MLNFILETFKNNENYNFINLDGKKLLKSQFEIVDSENEIIKIGNDTFLNLKTVKEVTFSHVASLEEWSKIY